MRALSEMADVTYFAEHVPSMNDIFLKVIGKETKWNEEQIESKQ